MSRTFSGNSVTTRIRYPAGARIVHGMNQKVVTSRVEVHLTRTPPATRLARAAGVSEVNVSGTVLTCVVSGSFQPLLEALQGYEVVRLWSVPHVPPACGEG
ncbi:hypothetical protein GCM10009767_13590 [Kocuria aegyptia]|uniref:Uncharacterized protein n=1 Tax=Kocuria aegyptia TaxID=330943 RepID=A0ABN2KGG7_9MICC